MNDIITDAGQRAASKPGVATVSKQGALLWAMVGALLLAAGLKIWLVSTDRIPFNADEAIVALMAKHILSGERPLFFYGQAYMGSLDAWLVAAGFGIFGKQVWVIRLVQTVLYLFTMASTTWLGKLIFGSWRVGVLAAWLLAIPTVNVTLYTTASLGGYGEALLIGNLTLALGLLISGKIAEGQRSLAIIGFAWGFLVGLGLWTFGITLVYSIPSAMEIAVAFRRQVRRNNSWSEAKKMALGGGACALLGFLLGSAPLFIFAMQQGLVRPLAELGGSAIAGVEGISWFFQFWMHLFNLIVLGVPVILGLRPPWGVEWLVIPLAPLILACWLALFVFQIKRRKAFSTQSPNVLLWIMFATALGFVITPFGADPSGRYFLPFTVPLALLAAEAIWLLFVRVGAWAWVAPALLLSYNFLGVVQSASQMPPGMTTQFDATTQVDQRYLPTLISFLRAHGETRGYTNYWVSYPLAFLSQEELIFIPVLPYHLDFRYTARDNRYPPYIEMVAQSERVAYITTRHPALDDTLRRCFQQAGTTWREAQIGDFHVFYDLSSPLLLDELDFGLTTP